jgi:hypothetical protein
MRRWAAIGLAGLLCGIGCRNVETGENDAKYAKPEAVSARGTDSPEAPPPQGRESPRAARAVRGGDGGSSDGGSAGGMDAGAAMQPLSDAGTR